MSRLKGADYDEELPPVIEEVDELSKPPGEVWTYGFPVYQQMDHDHRTVILDEGYVSEDGVNTNQVECLWSLLQPRMAKFRGPSKQGLGQAARTFSLLRALNLVEAPLHDLVDCIAVNAFR